MVTIRHRYHFGNIVLNECGVLSGLSVVGDKIPALDKSGDYIYKRYLGALDNVHLLHVQRVKLVNIVAYTSDELGLSDWIEIPNKHYLVGVYRDNGYYLLTKNGQPISHPL